MKLGVGDKTGWLSEVERVTLLLLVSVVDGSKELVFVKLGVAFAVA